MFIIRSVRRLVTIQKGPTLKTDPFSNHIEPQAVGMLRYMQNQTENLQKLPETTFGSGKINFIVMCEHQGRYQRCANWTLDLKNNILNEHHVDELINASATITAHDDKIVRLLDQRLDIGPAVTFGEVFFEGDESFKSKLPQILSCFTI